MNFNIHMQQYKATYRICLTPSRVPYACVKYFVFSACQMCGWEAGDGVQFTGAVSTILSGRPIGLGKDQVLEDRQKPLNILTSGSHMSCRSLIEIVLLRCCHMSQAVIFRYCISLDSNKSQPKPSVSLGLKN